MHHVCYEVEDISEAKNQMISNGARVLGSGEPTNRRSWKAGAFFASRGLLRNTDRTRASLIRYRRCPSSLINFYLEFQSLLFWFGILCFGSYISAPDFQLAKRAV